ncbi:helix-turn-helix domain-containing protein [Streptomyces sp. 3330]|uniref:helix-turn-helix domain-containing protein n=1 Tax=Streptomyces sp. 3330 TaxID=2817755 RepID=UPI00286A6707|nr:helix-turn-helix domain-containing protein [Streptomyces sp. 3330]
MVAARSEIRTGRRSHPAGSAAREWVRMLVIGGFAQGERNTVIAKELRVSLRSVGRWRRSWREGGRQALRHSGPAKRPKVGDQRRTRRCFSDHVRSQMMSAARVTVPR